MVLYHNNLENNLRFKHSSVLLVIVLSLFLFLFSKEILFINYIVLIHLLALLKFKTFK